ncbi:MAG: hypothetical protein HC819_12820 [Cyclobacteriaceae bacterium]|nr:hypothetical protein [Cyclobacteriaceae bacterium]
MDKLNAGKRYPAFYDRPHEITTQWNYTPASRWDFSLSWLYTSGAAITTPTGFYAHQQHTVPIYNERGNDRLPDYHRMDLSVNFRLNRREGRYKHSINFSIYNLYGQKNPVYVNFNKTKESRDELKVPGDFSQPHCFRLPRHTFIASYHLSATTSNYEHTIDTWTLDAMCTGL